MRLRLRLRTQRVENDRISAVSSMSYPRDNSQSAWKWLLAIGSPAVS
jgi:hypothetical protein